MRRARLAATAGFLLGVLPLHAAAASAGAPLDTTADPLTIVDARSLGLAGASRGTPADHANIQLAPSVLALDMSYKAEATGYLLPEGQRGFQVSAVDSQTGPVTLGVAYRFHYQGDEALLDSEYPGWKQLGESLSNRVRAQAVALGLAVADKEKRVSIGLGGMAWWRSAEVAGSSSGWRMTASISGRPHPTLVLDTGVNLNLWQDGARGVAGESWIDTGLRWQPIKAVGLMTDLALPTAWAAPTWSFGTELAPAETWPLRFGVLRVPGADVWGLTAGLAIVSEAFALQYGARVDLRNTSYPDLTVPNWHMLTLSAGF